MKSQKHSLKKSQNAFFIYRFEIDFISACLFWQYRRSDVRAIGGGGAIFLRDTFQPGFYRVKFVATDA
jgi:hypothetical protein